MHKIKYYNWLSAIIILALFESIVFALFFRGPGIISKIIMALIGHNLMFFPAMGFLMGLVIALIPYKKLPYSKRYLRASFIGIISWQLLMLITCCLIGVRRGIDPKVFLLF